MFTTIACLIIFFVFAFSWMYIHRTHNAELVNRKKWIAQLPNVVSTLGVLGTFLGITKGLISFDTSDLDTSIPMLLDGLKTAFFTSLLGMSGSLILNRVVSHKFDTETQVSEIEKAAQKIVETLTDNQSKLPSILEDSNRNLVTVLSEDETAKAIHFDIEQLKDDIEEIKGHIEALKSTLDTIETSAKSTASEIPLLRAISVTATASISTIDNNIDEINKSVKSIKTTVSDINDNVETIKLKEEEEGF